MPQSALDSAFARTVVLVRDLIGGMSGGSMLSICFAALLLAAASSLPSVQGESLLTRARVRRQGCR